MASPPPSPLRRSLSAAALAPPDAGVKSDAAEAKKPADEPWKPLPTTPTQQLVPAQRRQPPPPRPVNFGP